MRNKEIGSFVEMGDRPERGILKRFRNIRAEIGRDGEGEYLEIVLPAGELPFELFDLLKSIGLRESQRNEIAGQIESFGFANYLMDHQDP
jgi:hypothetical protein